MSESLLERLPPAARATPLRTLRTARWLTARQSLYQVLERAGLRPSRPRAYGEDATWRFATPSLPFIRRYGGAPTRFLNGEFELLNQRHAFAGQIDWSYEGLGGLWLDQLHYFRYVENLGGDVGSLAQWAAFLEDWNARGTTARKAFLPPYNPSERAFVLGRLMLANASRMRDSARALHERVIVRDLAHVARRLEFHVDGNHLLKNLCAILWGSMLFEGSESRRWRGLADRYLPDALQQQILPDGMHYERSPAYHVLAAIDLFDIFSVTPANDIWHERLAGVLPLMTAAARMFAHPGGDLCQFNDGTAEQLRAPADLFAVGAGAFGPVPAVSALPAAGYYCVADDETYFCIADAGPLGPADQPGHGHADLLSFELSVRGERVIVDSGTSTYYDQPYRRYERSTFAHNTVVVERTDQAELWGSFRATDRPAVWVERWQIDRTARELDAWHDAYRTRFGIRHSRHFRSSSEAGIAIHDKLTGRSGIRFTLYLHLSPDVRIASRESRRIVVTTPCGRGVEVVSSRDLYEMEALVADGFNRRRIAPVLCADGTTSAQLAAGDVLTRVRAL
jgi:uncharacterized heparinase superfamily protein